MRRRPIVRSEGFLADLANLTALRRVYRRDVEVAMGGHVRLLSSMKLLLWADRHEEGFKSRDGEPPPPPPGMQPPPPPPPPSA